MTIIRPLAVLLLLGLAGCTSVPIVSSTYLPTSTPTVAEAESDGSREAPFSFGEVVHVSSDSIWDFTIHSPQPDANSWVAQGDEYNEAPAEGFTWVGANIAVTVRDTPQLDQFKDEAIAPTFSLNPVFIGANGTVYDFWTVNYPALFAGSSWSSLPDTFLSAGLSWDQPFGIQVPSDQVQGGFFAVRHEVSGKIVVFDAG